MSKKKKMKQSTKMEDHDQGKQDFFDKVDYDVSSILLQLSHPVVFSSDYSPLQHKWGRTKKRSTLVFLNPAKKISPEPVSTEIAGMGSTSSSSCLTGEANKTIFHSVQAETGLIGTQVGFQAQPIVEMRRLEDQHLPHLQPSICFDRTANMRDNLGTRGFDLNLPLPVTMVDFQRAAAAQARQRRLSLIRSKKLYNKY